MYGLSNEHILTADQAEREDIKLDRVYSSSELGLTLEYPAEWEGKFDFSVRETEYLGTALDIFILPRSTIIAPISWGRIWKIECDRWEREHIPGGELMFIAGTPYVILAESKSYIVGISFSGEIQSDEESRDIAKMISEGIEHGKLHVNLID
jgi:hypothetical protein